MTTDTIKKLVEQGASIILERKMSSESLREIAQIAKDRGAKITINADSYTSTTLEELAAIGNKNLTFIIK